MRQRHIHSCVVFFWFLVVLKFPTLRMWKTLESTETLIQIFVKYENLTQFS
jgi:hypothetical protein